ncbi:uncharacterized protein PAC_08943 [Phialocephala subalpina]|uniref:NAD(P)-binding domain-containing protein n=1 Tax=Phialocephala subalpina TaxID=576137 RepID=A0A1L7X1Z1_9HELO|nr:uncharacterized protein PAC_08943 [Phialocephala subalpina]
MKVIIAGATGLIGSEVLSNLIQNKNITSIIILSRRPLPEVGARDSRIKVIVLSNFLEYNGEVKKELNGAKAVLWALGGSNSNPTPSEKMDELEVQYPLALANALLSTRDTGKENNESATKLRFLFISGTLSERDQSRKLWFLEQGRKARGLAENRLFELSKQNPEVFEAVIIKAAYVIPKSALCNMIPDLVVGGSGNAIRAEELGAAMVYCALDRHGSETIGNGELRSIGRRLFKS